MGRQPRGTVSCPGRETGWGAGPARAPSRPHPSHDSKSGAEQRGEFLAPPGNTDPQGHVQTLTWRGASTWLFPGLVLWFPPRGWVGGTFGNVRSLGCRDWERWGRQCSLLASNGWRSGLLLYVPRGTGHPSPRESSDPNGYSAEAKKPWSS